MDISKQCNSNQTLAQEVISLEHHTLLGGSRGVSPDDLRRVGVNLWSMLIFCSRRVAWIVSLSSVVVTGDVSDGRSQLVM